MHILRGVLIADIKGKGATAFKNANGYLGWISTLPRAVFRVNSVHWTHVASLPMHLLCCTAKPIVPAHWRLVAKQYLNIQGVFGRIIRGYHRWRTWRGLALKPGRTSVANQAWTWGATRRQQITDLINDRRASARLILAPKKLGNKVGWWRSGVFRFADINTWWGMQLLLHTFLFKVLLFRLFIKSSYLYYHSLVLLEEVNAKPE